MNQNHRKIACYDASFSFGAQTTNSTLFSKFQINSSKVLTNQKNIRDIDNDVLYQYKKYQPRGWKA